MTDPAAVTHGQIDRERVDSARWRLLTALGLLTEDVQSLHIDVHLQPGKEWLLDQLAEEPGAEARTNRYLDGATLKEYRQITLGEWPRYIRVFAPAHTLEVVK